MPDKVRDPAVLRITGTRHCKSPPCVMQLYQYCYRQVRAGISSRPSAAGVWRFGCCLDVNLRGCLCRTRTSPNLKQFYDNGSVPPRRINSIARANILLLDETSHLLTATVW